MPGAALERGRHDKLCKQIKKQAALSNTTQIRSTRRPSRSRRGMRGGHEAQACYICMSPPLETKEGLVRGCACRGTAGFAHVSCLAEQAKILVRRWRTIWARGGECEVPRWDTRLCEQATTASCGARSGGRAGRRTWDGRSGPLGAWRWGSRERFAEAKHTRTHLCERPNWLWRASCTRSIFLTRAILRAVCSRPIRRGSRFYKAYIRPFFHGEEYGQTLVAANNYALSLLKEP